MATMTEIPEAVNRQAPSHDYHAKAYVLSGHLERPVDQEIEEQAEVNLHDRRGGHFTRYSENVSIEGLISFTKGKTRVSGSRSLKTNGWVTLSTSIMEGFNAFEVITADRIVSQVSTEHPYENGHIPQVTFLGTQFTNLSVSGFPVPLNLNLGICGARPAGDRSYLRDTGFLEGVREQTANIANADGLPKELKARYDERLVYVDSLIRASREGVWQNDEPRVICSLVQSIGEIPIPGVTSYGNVLVIPDFGSVSFGDIVVGEKNYEDSTRPCVYFELNGMNVNMGCVGDGNYTATTATANGTTRP